MVVSLRRHINNNNPMQVIAKHNNTNIKQFILLQALSRVCMENTEINTALGFASCCIYLETHPRVLYFSYK